MESHKDLQPGLLPVLHHQGSSFMRVYCKDIYKYSILLETCVEGGFQYREYYYYQDPGFFGDFGVSAMVSNFRIPKKDHAGNFSEHIRQLEQDGFVLIYTREVPTEIILDILERKITLEGTLFCKLGVALQAWPSSWWDDYDVTFNPLRINLPYKNGKIVIEKETCLLSEKFTFGFQQIRAGAVAIKNNNRIDLSASKNGGCGGDAFTKTLIQCFESEHAARLPRKTIIDLSGNVVNEGELLQALLLKKIPVNYFTGLSPNFERKYLIESKKLELYSAFYTLYLGLSQTQNHPLFDRDAIRIILCQSICLLIKELEDCLTDMEVQAFSFDKCHSFFKSQPKPLTISYDFNKQDQHDLAFNIAEKVVGRLDFSFNYDNQGFTLISPFLSKEIMNEVSSAYSTIIFPALAAVQVNVLISLIHGEINGYTENDLIGAIKVKATHKNNFNVVTGEGLEPQGVVGACYSYLSMDMLNLLKRRVMDQALSASHDELKSSPESRIRRFAFELFVILAKAANPDQLAIMYEESLNKDSKCMKLLTNNSGLLSTNYDKLYCNILEQLVQEKSQAQVGYKK